MILAKSIPELLEESSLGCYIMIDQLIHNQYANKRIETWESLHLVDFCDERSGHMADEKEGQQDRCHVSLQKLA